MRRFTLATPKDDSVCSLKTRFRLSTPAPIKAINDEHSPQQQSGQQEAVELMGHSHLFFLGGGQHAELTALKDTSSAENIGIAS